ncbi:MAG: Ribosomal protein [Candidatus Doudnabacteria bacterium]|nr:Ribosomal protein [Candidatus Doudnabacteria bacterium]
MKIKELRLKKDAELHKDLAALQEKSRELRFKMFSQEVKNVKEVSGIRKTIARIKTLLGERKDQSN